MIRGLNEAQKLFLEAKRGNPESLNRALSFIHPIVLSYAEFLLTKKKAILIDEDDLAIIGLEAAQRAIEKYVFRCDCSMPFKTEEAFKRHCKKVHNGREKVRGKIWEFVDHGVRQYIRNAIRDEWRNLKDKQFIQEKGGSKNYLGGVLLSTIDGVVIGETLNRYSSVALIDFETPEFWFGRKELMAELHQLIEEQTTKETKAILEAMLSGHTKQEIVEMMMADKQYRPRNRKAMGRLVKRVARTSKQKAREIICRQ